MFSMLVLLVMEKGEGLSGIGDGSSWHFRFPLLLPYDHILEMETLYRALLSHYGCETGKLWPARVGAASRASLV